MAKATAKKKQAIVREGKVTTDKRGYNEFGRLETTIEKLAEATTELALGVAGQRERLNNLEKDKEQQQVAIATVIETQNDGARYIHERINTVQADLTNKLVEQTDKLAKHIDESTVKLTGEMKDSLGVVNTRTEHISARVEALEKWRWLIVGGGIVAGLIVTGVFVTLIVKLLENMPWFK